VLESRHRILTQRSTPLLDAIKPHNDVRFKSFSTGSTPQFSGGALNYVAWHFMPDRPLQLLVRRLAHDFYAREYAASGGATGLARFLFRATRQVSPF
jgi:hypothetical protein